MTRRMTVPGSLVVQLQDMAGKSAPGYVFIDRAHDLPFVASTDENGEVRFAGVEPQVWNVEANLKGQPTAHDYTVDGTNSPLPADKELIYKWMIPTRESTACPGGTETRIVMRAAPVGYVRGTVHLGAGINPDQVFISTDSLGGDSLRKSGEFVVGPLPAGKVVVKLQYSPTSTSSIECAGENRGGRQQRRCRRAASISICQLPRRKRPSPPQSCGIVRPQCLSPGRNLTKRSPSRPVSSCPMVGHPRSVRIVELLIPKSGRRMATEDDGYSRAMLDPVDIARHVLVHPRARGEARPDSR